jgi:hypothetical protein
MDTILSSLTTLAAVVLGYWFALLSQDRERDVRAQSGAELLWREVSLLRHEAEERAPNAVTAETASRYVELNPWTEELVGRLAARNPDLAFQVMHVPDILTGLQSAVAPIGETRSAISNQERRARLYEGFMAQKDGYEEEYLGQVRSANEALAGYSKTLAAQLDDYRPIYESLLHRLKGIEVQLMKESQLPIMSAWARAWRSLPYRVRRSTRPRPSSFGMV